jgi:hypothetical protein
MGMLFFFLINAPWLWAEPPLHVGILRTSQNVAFGTKASDTFTLLREGKEIKTRWGMRVYIGDEIRPRKQGCVLLVYIKIGCKELEIDQNTTVQMPEEFAVAARPDKEEIKMLPKGSDDIYHCFPTDSLCLSPWPMKDSTLLAGETAFFRWYSPRMAPCDTVRLVIVSAGKSDFIIEQEMQAGELKAVNADFKAGESYQWFVEKPNHTRLSEKYPFRILTQEDSDTIRRQLAHIKTLYADTSPVLYQALYLQFISDAGGLNLYADSLRLCKDYLDKSDISLRLIENLKNRCERK